MLLADDDIQTWVSLSEPVECFVVGECWTDEHNVIKAKAESAEELVYEKLRLARVCRPDDEHIEGDVARIHFNSAQIPAVYSLCSTGHRK